MPLPKPALPVFNYKTLFFILSAFLLVLLPYLSRDYGIVWDDWMDSNNGMLALRNILKLGNDMAFMDFWHGYLYSQLFYTITGSLYGLFFDHIRNIAYEGLHREAHILPFYAFSHLMTSLFGFLGMFFTGLLAKKAGSWRTGFLALLFIALSPRFFGNSMNNPKDIPFAATYAMAIYYLVRYLEGLPAMRWRDWALLIFGTGCCIGARIGGILLLAYLFLFVGLLLFKLFLTEEIDAKCAAKHLGIAAAIACLGLAFGYIFWPYGRLDPLRNTFSAMQKISTFGYWKGQVLFEGKDFKDAHMHWYYTPKWIAISSQLFMLLSLPLAILSAKKLFKKFTFRIHFPIFFAGIFPLLYMIYRKTPVMDSWRHSLFIYPSMVVFAALAWDCFLEWAHSVKRKCVVAAGLLFLLMEPLFWMAKNHPNTYVYFNPLVGGVRGALGKYETDYWGNCLGPAADWLGEYHLKNALGKFPLAAVRADGQVMQTYPFLKRRLGGNYKPLGYPTDFLHTNPYFFVNYGPLRRPLPWNYAIVFSRSFTPKEIQNGDWPPKDTIHEVKADGVTLCAVVENHGFKEFLKTFFQWALYTHFSKKGDLLRFGAAPEVLGQKLFCGLIKLHLILRFRETVPFIRKQPILHGNPAPFQGFHNLIELRLFYARIIGALGDEQRGFDLIGFE